MKLYNVSHLSILTLMSQLNMELFSKKRLLSVPQIIHLPLLILNFLKMESNSEKLKIFHLNIFKLRFLIMANLFSIKQVTIKLQSVILCLDATKDYRRAAKITNRVLKLNIIMWFKLYLIWMNGLKERQ